MYHSAARGIDHRRIIFVPFAVLVEVAHGGPGNSRWNINDAFAVECPDPSAIWLIWGFESEIVSLCDPPE